MKKILKRDRRRRLNTSKGPWPGEGGTRGIYRTIFSVFVRKSFENFNETLRENHDADDCY